MPAPQKLEKPKQLLVEGRDCMGFCIPLLRNLNIGDRQVQDFGGITELRPFLRGLTSQSEFVTGGVGALAVMRDADQDATGAFASVQGALRQAGLPVPTRVGEPLDGRLRVVAMILPDNTSTGMLETLCLRSVSDDAAMRCLDEYFQCLEEAFPSGPRYVEKARVQAFLASRDRPGLLLGQAAERGYWPWGSPAFDKVKQFLQAI